MKVLKPKFGWLLVVLAVLMIAGAVEGLAAEQDETVSRGVTTPKLGAAQAQLSTPVGPSRSPVSPEFIAWQEKVETLGLEMYDEEGHALGHIPSPFDWSHMRSQSAMAPERVGAPASYDLRAYGHVTPVKDQNNCGSCWTFGTYGSLESWLLKNPAENWDFSENHLKNYHGFDWLPCAGGNADISTAYLSRWSGPVSESDDPYNDWDDRPSPGGPCQKYLESALWFYTATDMKNELMASGAMYISFYWDAAYYESSDYTYYYNGALSANHAVTLIGWDDSKATAAPLPGAWLLKNSWGTGWGNAGYFWISYYDTYAQDYAVSFRDAVPTSSYLTIYQYDPLGRIGGYGYGSTTAWGANVFIPTADEPLEAVGFYAGADNTSYEIYVYDNFDGSTFSVLLGSVSGTVSEFGYHTITLPSPISLTNGDDFSIVIKFTTPGYTFPVPGEWAVAGYSSAASSGAGESYLSSDGTSGSWYDLGGGPEQANVCIKGLTSKEEEEPTIKYVQNPDLSEMGIDVDTSRDLMGMGPWSDQLLADDFPCTTTGLITDIHIWGSWLWDELPNGEPNNVDFTLSIHADLPVGDPNNPFDYSIPGEILWIKDFLPGEFHSAVEASGVPEGYFVPCEPYYEPVADWTCWRYDFYIDPCEAFMQEGDPCNLVVYWLDVQALTDGMTSPARFGWKTSLEHWNDDAVYAVGDEFGHGPWQELRYPLGHEYEGISIDLAFAITTEEEEPNIPEPKAAVPHLKWSQPPIKIDPNADMPTYCGWDQLSYTDDPCCEYGAGWQVVADDYRCLGTMPVTSIHWWGSYVGWQDPEPPLQKPIAWRIGFWSNVPEEVGVPQAGQKTNLGEAALSAKAVSSAKPPPSLPVRRTAATKTARSLQAALEKPSVRAISSSLSASRFAVGGEALGGGDTCATATVIGALPYFDTGETCSFMDDYDEICPWDAPGSSDVVYEYTPASDIAIDISLCDSAYDTKVYVYVGGCPGTLVACNDDACGDDGYKSQLLGVSLTAGNTYYIIVDGYGGECGDYIIDVTEVVPPPPGPNCPPDTLFGQPAHGPGDPYWTAITSDANTSGSYLVYENFWDVDAPICDIHFWGLSLYNDGVSWYECDEDPMTFEIKFYQNDPCGDPGTEVCSYTIPITRTATGLQYAGVDLWEYSADLEPCCGLTDGWVSIQGVSIASPDCWFLWMDSGTGDGLSYQWQDPNLVLRVEDLSLCLTGEEPPPTFSYPETLLWQIEVPADRVDVNLAGTDYFPEKPDDTCFQYYVDLEPNEVFWQEDYIEQTQDNIFWLSIAAIYPQESTPSYPWGWKTRPWSWMDDAVTFSVPILEQGMVLGPMDVTPIKDPVYLESYDVAFELDTDPNYIKWEQPFTGIRHWPHYEDELSMATGDNGEPDILRLVADDWLCERRTPVTAAVWWGSYIGYGYEVCQGPPAVRPVKPDYFRLNIWTDVPKDPNVPASFSHPNDMIWEYKAYDYDEVLVGYDKYPHGEPNEPVFRYSVRLPEVDWFEQPDVNGIFWLSVLAVYDVNTPNYDWGWTNHEHMFQDDAVEGYFVPPAGWFWSELYDQTEVNSVDMSFILFTDPNECVNCADYNIDYIINFKDYADFADDWLWTGVPGGYNNSDLDCDGDADWYDLKIFADQWLSSCP